jgi:flavin-dependent dehydrogenase
MLQAAFVIDATGRHSIFARRQGCKRIFHDHLIGLTGFFALPVHAEQCDTRTLIEAVENGWWYSALLPNNRLVTAFMTDFDLLPRGREAIARYWKAQFEQTIHTRRRVVSDVILSDIHTVLASSSVLNRITGQGWLAVGDAACSFDPLSSQGICWAMESGIVAAQSIAEWRDGQTDALQNSVDRVIKQFADYLLTRRLYYAQERRWPKSTFWRRQQFDSTAKGNP